jgi:hypothetical protein
VLGTAAIDPAHITPSLIPSKSGDEKPFDDVERVGPEADEEKQVTSHITRFTLIILALNSFTFSGWDCENWRLLVLSAGNWLRVGSSDWLLLAANANVQEWIRRLAE